MHNAYTQLNVANQKETWARLGATTPSQRFQLTKTKQLAADESVLDGAGNSHRVCAVVPENEHAALP
jgi:hypothetical protein